MGLLSREDLLGKTKRRFKTINLPGGGQWRIQSLSEYEKSQYELWILNKKTNMASADKMLVSRQKLIALCSVDDKGDRCFGDGDLSALGEIDSVITVAIWDACREWVGFDKGDIEELVKNSETIPVDSSPTD